MNLNYDSFRLIVDQVKTDLFLLYSCRRYKRMIKDRKYIIGTKYNFFSCPWEGGQWEGGKPNIDQYIVGLLEDIDIRRPKYGIEIYSDEYTCVYLYNEIELHTEHYSESE